MIVSGLRTQAQPRSGLAPDDEDFLLANKVYRGGQAANRMVEYKRKEQEKEEKEEEKEEEEEERKSKEKEHDHDEYADDTFETLFVKLQDMLFPPNGTAVVSRADADRMMMKIMKVMEVLKRKESEEKEEEEEKEKEEEEEEEEEEVVGVRRGQGKPEKQKDSRDNVDTSAVIEALTGRVKVDKARVMKALRDKIRKNEKKVIDTIMSKFHSGMSRAILENIKSRAKVNVMLATLQKNKEGRRDKQDKKQTATVSGMFKVRKEEEEEVEEEEEEEEEEKRNTDRDASGFLRILGN